MRAIANTVVFDKMNTKLEYGYKLSGDKFNQVVVAKITAPICPPLILI